jgi:hypothetical protein
VRSHEPIQRTANEEDRLPVGYCMFHGQLGQLQGVKCSAEIEE